MRVNKVGDNASKMDKIYNPFLLSPLNNYIAIGMKVRRFSITRDSPLIEFYKLDEAGQSDRVGSMKPRNTVNGYPRIQQFVVNAISFMPGYVPGSII